MFGRETCKDVCALFFKFNLRIMFVLIFVLMSLFDCLLRKGHPANCHQSQTPYPWLTHSHKSKSKRKKKKKRHINIYSNKVMDYEFICLYNLKN